MQQPNINEQHPKYVTQEDDVPFYVLGNIEFLVAMLV